LLDIRTSFDAQIHYNCNILYIHECDQQNTTVKYLDTKLLYFVRWISVQMMLIGSISTKWNG